MGQAKTYISDYYSEYFGYGSIQLVELNSLYFSQILNDLMKFATFILALLPFAFCTNRNDQIAKLDGVNDFFQEEIQAFNTEIKDSTLFIYSNIKSFDTSFIFLVERNRNDFKGRLYYYPPAYYKDFGDWRYSNVFLYKAANITITQAKWVRLKNKLSKIFQMNINAARDISDQIIHQPVIKVYFDNQLISSKSKKNFIFDSVYSIFETDILNDILINYPLVNGKVP